MTIRALIFDVDGTLAETEDLHRIAFNAAFAEAGLDWVWPQVLYRRLLTTTGGKERIARHSTEKGPELGAAEIARLHARKTEIYAALIADGAAMVRPGIRELVGNGRESGLKLGIATTTSLPNVEALCRAVWDAPVLSVFDAVAAGDEVAQKKPDPEVYRLCLDRLGCRAEEALAFEDSANGLRAARAAGIRTVVTPAVYTRHEDFSGAEQILPSLESFRLPADA